MVTTQLRTAQDLLHMGDRGDNFILIAGELVEVSPPTGAHGRLTTNIAMIVGTFVLENPLGQVYTGDTGYILQKDPDSVLAPDLSFIASERVPADDNAYLEVPPDLVVEVVSPSNSAREIERKVATYLKAGVRQVWIIYPKRRQVAVYKPKNVLRVFGDSEEIDCAPELPGLTVPVAHIFDGPRATSR